MPAQVRSLPTVDGTDVRIIQSIIRVGDYLRAAQSEYTPKQAGKPCGYEALHAQAKHCFVFITRAEMISEGSYFSSEGR